MSMTPEQIEAGLQRLKTKINRGKLFDKIMDVISVMLILFVVISCSILMYKAFSYKEPPQEEHVYYIKYGSVLCGHIEYLSCGVRLSKCADDYVYECMSDVRRSR